MNLDSRIQLGMTIDEVKAILGEPITDSVQQNPVILVYGDFDVEKGDYLELTFYSEKQPPGVKREKRTLVMVMQMPEHDRIMPPLTDEEREYRRKLQEEWDKEDEELRAKGEL